MRRFALRQTLAAASLSLLAGLSATAAQAATPATQGQVTAAVQKPLPLYAHPGDANAAQTVAADNLPWPILEAKDDFYRVRIGGRDYWVDGMTVRVARAAKAACDATVTQGKTNNSPTGSTPGAGENACR